MLPLTPSPEHEEGYSSIQVDAGRLVQSWGWEGAANPHPGPLLCGWGALRGPRSLCTQPLQVWGPCAPYTPTPHIWSPRLHNPPVIAPSAWESPWRRHQAPLGVKAPVSRSGLAGVGAVTPNGDPPTHLFLIPAVALYGAQVFSLSPDREPSWSRGWRE